MKIKITAIAALAASFAVAATAASAAPAAAPAQATPTGPIIPGLCVLNQAQMVHDSAVGKWVITRLGQLKSQVDAELNSEATTLQNDEKTFEAGRASMTQDQMQKQGGALGARERALQQKAQLRNQELEATQEKAIGVIGQSSSPIITTIATQRSCSVLLNGTAVMAAAPSMDITSSVVQQLDAKIQTFAFDREHLDTQAGAPAR